MKDNPELMKTASQSPKKQLLKAKTTIWMEALFIFYRYIFI